MKSFLLLVILSFGFCFANSQLILEGQLLDANSKETLPFANVGIVKTSWGTITNADGKFKLETPNPTDTLACSFIGYESLKIPVSQFPKDGLLYLKSQAISLETAVITANNFLYDIVSKCKANRVFYPYTAKTHFSLDSYMNGYPVEMVECYYNGEFSGYKIEKLNIKSGRIYLADYNKHYFTNLETSKAITSLDIFSNNPYFPTTPFELKRKRLLETYQLRLLNKFNDEGTVYHISFQPSQSTNRFFSGEAWIDSASNSLLKVHLTAADAQPHPFVPIWENDSIIQIDLDIQESFKRENGQLYFDVANFKYDMKYLDRKKNRNSIKTEGVLHTYDLNNQFILPYYEYDEDASDYRKIAGFPYNEFFWQHRDSVVLSEKQSKSMDYMNQYGFVLHRNTKTPIKNDFFQYNNIEWDRTKRVKIKELTDSAKVIHAGGVIPTNLYGLKAQLFFDINQHGQTINLLSKSLYDIFKSYYYYTPDSVTDCFANIYFDIIETERLEFEKEITNPKLTVKQIQSLYIQRLEKTKQLTQRYFREVERGYNTENLIKWNRYVAMRLGIDNMALFRIAR